MAKPTYTETRFTAVLKKPVDLVAELFRENTQMAPGNSVPLVAESPQRYSTASAFIWFGVVMLAVLIGFSLAVAVSQAMEWSWGVGLLFAAGTLIGFSLGVTKYYSFGGVQDQGITVFQSGQNLVGLEEPWWFQATEKLRYIFSAGVFNARFVVKDCQTKADGGETMLVSLVFESGMSLTDKDDAVLVWLRGIAAEAMQSGQDATKILKSRLKAMPDQICEVLKNALEPYTTAKTYRGLRQEGRVFQESEAEAVVAGSNHKLAVLGLPVRFAANAKVVDIIPPPKVQEQEEREAARLEKEQKNIAALGARVAVVRLGDIAKLQIGIEGIDIPAAARDQLLAKLKKRGQELEANYQEQQIAAAAVHAGKVAERTDDWGVEMDALLALSDPDGQYASKVRQLIKRRKAAPDHLETALLVRRSQATSTNGVEAQAEVLVHKAISATQDPVSA